MNRTALVTGANGWLGKNLVKFITNGHPDHESLIESSYDEVRCLVLKGENVDFLEGLSDKIKIYYGDICDPSSLKDFFNCSDQFDLYHTAGIIHPKIIRDFYKINVEGTKNLLNLLDRSRVRKVVIVSSNSPIGCNPFSDHLFDEDSKYNPYMNYGRSKMLMEQKATKLAQEKELMLTFIRCPWFYGPNQPPRQTLFFSMIKDGKMPIVGNGDNKRSMS